VGIVLSWIPWLPWAAQWRVGSLGRQPGKPDRIYPTRWLCTAAYPYMHCTCILFLMCIDGIVRWGAPTVWHDPLKPAHGPSSKSISTALSHPQSHPQGGVQT